MRLVPAVVVGIVLLGAVPSPRDAFAQVTFDGLVHHAMGGAVLEYDPIARRLPVRNLGSSGQDGVRLDWPNDAAGAGSPPLIMADGVMLHTSGLENTASHQITLLSGATVGGTITVVRNAAAGSETMQADFSSAGALHVTVVVVDDDMQDVARQTMSGPVTTVLTISGTNFAAASPILVPVVKDRMGATVRTPSVRQFQFHYTNQIYVTGGTFNNVPCHSIIVTAEGQELDTGKQLTVTGSSSPGSPPTEFALERVGIVPPCAGCPNGPDELGMCVATGNATFEIFTSSTGERRGGVRNLGSSGQDGVSLNLKGARTDCCSVGAGYTNNFVYNRPAGSTLDYGVNGYVSGVEQSLGTMHVDALPSHLQLVPDFSSAGAASYHVRLRRNGALLAEATDPAGGVSLSNPAPESSVQTDTQTSTGAAGFRIICITSPCPGWPVVMNGASYVADEITFEPTGSSLALLIPGTLTSLTLHGTGGDLPLDGIRVISTAHSVASAPVAGAAALRTSLYPNPASGPVSVVFALPQASTARVAVVDVAGRQVKALASDRLAAGAHELRWDGRDESGRLAAAGVYFVRIETAGATRVARLTRIW